MENVKIKQIGASQHRTTLLPSRSHPTPEQVWLIKSRNMASMESANWNALAVLLNFNEFSILLRNTKYAVKIVLDRRVSRASFFGCFDNLRALCWHYFPVNSMDAVAAGRKLYAISSRGSSSWGLPPTSVCAACCFLLGREYHKFIFNCLITCRCLHNSPIFPDSLLKMCVTNVGRWLHSLIFVH